MDDRQQKLLTMLAQMQQTDGAPDNRDALLRFAAAQMDDDGRRQLREVMRDREAVESLLRSPQAKALREAMQRRKE